MGFCRGMGLGFRVWGSQLLKWGYVWGLGFGGLNSLNGVMYGDLGSGSRA